MEKLNNQMLMKALDWSYENAMKGIPGTLSAIELADSYLKKNNDADKAINSLIKWQQSKCGTSGFLSGLGGVITLPVSIPANLASVLYVQIRMVAAIAHIRGYDLKDDQVKTFVYVCLTGQSGTEALKQMGKQIGKEIGKAQIKKIPGHALKKVNQTVGFRLVTKFGEKGVVNLGKAIPIIGGLVGGTVDTISTFVIGKAAKKTFLNDGYDSEKGLIIEL